MPYDLVIRDGTIVDGSGLASYRADVGVTNGRIMAIGSHLGKGNQEIQAEGHVVSPGFVDGHTHMDAQVMWDPLGTCSCWHGVTTVVMGNCGFTLAPSHADRRDLVVRNLEKAEDISAAAMQAGIHWDWETYAEYLDAVDRTPKGINYAGYVGHSALRTWAMGERAFESTATDADLNLMKEELHDALRAGAWGFTTSRSDAHETSDGRPVASRLADWSEVEILLGAMGAAGGGMFELSLEPAYNAVDPLDRKEFFDRLRALAVTSGIPTSFGVIATPEGTWRELLQCVDDTSGQGGRMFAQCHSRAISILLSFKTRLPFDRIPEWQEMRSLPLARQRAMLEDPLARERLVDAAREGSYGISLGVEAARPDYDHLHVLHSPSGPNPTLNKIASERNQDPVDVMIDLALESDFNQFFVQEIHNRNDEEVLAIMKHPRSIMTFSDSGAHVSQIMDSSIQTHLLSYWVREKEAFTLEEAVRKITLEPARAWGFADRGLLMEGLVADINVFDPTTVAPLLPTLESDLPGGAKRLKQKSAGIRATIVKGEVLMEDGEHTGALPGSLVRRAVPK
jgi:N-acyl-D-amino-acid deacylase